MIVALSLFARNDSSSFKKCISDQGKYYHDQANIEGSPNLSVPLSEREPIAFKCTGEFIDTNNPAINALSTVVIAIFTIVLAVTTNRQAALAKESFVADKRASVYPVSMPAFWVPMPDGEYSWRFQATWKNSGSTPTVGWRHNIECEVRNSPLPTNYDFSHFSLEYGSGHLGPFQELNGGLAPSSARAAVTPQDILDAQAGRKFIYLRGVVEYNDVFPDTPRHVTTFCWNILPIGDPKAFMHRPEGTPGRDAITFRWTQHTHGNAAK